MVDVGQMAPQRSVLDATGDTEVCFSAGGCARDPAATGDEVSPGADRRTRAGNVGMRGGDNNVRNAIDDNVQCINGDITRP